MLRRPWPTDARAAWEFGLPERGEAEGSEAGGAGADDALVLGMMRRPWQLGPAQNRAPLRLDSDGQ